MLYFHLGGLTTKKCCYNFWYRTFQVPRPGDVVRMQGWWKTWCFCFVFSPVELLASNGMVGNFKFCNPTAVSFCLFQSCYVVECFFGGLRLRFAFSRRFGSWGVGFEYLQWTLASFWYLGCFGPQGLGWFNRLQQGFNSMNPGCSGLYRGWNTTHLHRDYKKPL